MLVGLVLLRGSLETTWPPPDEIADVDEELALEGYVSIAGEGES